LTTQSGLWGCRPGQTPCSLTGHLCVQSQRECNGPLGAACLHSAARALSSRHAATDEDEDEDEEEDDDDDDDDDDDEEYVQKKHTEHGDDEEEERERPRGARPVTDCHGPLQRGPPPSKTPSRNTCLTTPVSPHLSHHTASVKQTPNSRLSVPPLCPRGEPLLLSIRMMSYGLCHFYIYIHIFISMWTLYSCPPIGSWYGATCDLCMIDRLCVIDRVCV